MRTSLAMPVLCVCMLISGLVCRVGDGWAQTSTGADAESQAVKSVIDLQNKAINSRDLKLLLAQFADDAKIDSKAAGGKVSKREYGQAMSRSFALGSILSSTYSDLKISLVDATHALAEGTIRVNLKGGGGFTSRHEWRLEKRDDRWLIVETSYK